VCVESKAELIAKQNDQVESFHDGLVILRELSESDKVDIKAYRGKRISLLGSAAIPGGTNDLQTDGGYYIRVVNKGNKDLRPHSTFWTVFITGTVSQILKENKIIILTIDDENWRVVETF
jgi:hypothetical protein